MYKRRNIGDFRDTGVPQFAEPIQSCKMLMRFANAFSLAVEKSRNGADKTSTRVKRV